MILMSGVNMFAMAVVMKVVLGWDITFSILVSSVAVALYVGLGGLRSAIFNEVLQFVLIWGGALLVPILGMIQAGGVGGLKTKIITNLHSDTYFHLWRDTGHFAANPMGVHWTGIVLGLGFVISFGYWTTDFLVVQRVLAAHNLRAARMAPIIGSYFKMAVPFIVILPGLLSLVLLQNPDGSRRVLVGEDVVKSCALSVSGEQIGDPGACSSAMATKTSLTPAYQANVLSAAPGTELHSYNEALPLMLVRYCGPGLLGLGITALIAGFMSGMAGNVSAFSTVWTYDIYKPLINKKGTDSHYVAVGRMSIVIGVAVSIGAALPGDACARHHGLRSGVVQLLYSAVAGGHPDGHVLEAGHRAGGFPGPAGRHRDFSQLVCLGEIQSLAFGVRRAIARCQAHGRKSLPRTVGVFHLRHHHLCGEPVYQAQAGGGVRRTGLRGDHTSQGRACSVLQECVDMGSAGGMYFCGSEHFVLVNEELSILVWREGVKTYAWFRNSYLVLYRSAAGHLRRDDFQLWHV